MCLLVLKSKLGGVESPDDADETSALIRSTGLLREPGDAVVGGDVASDAAGDLATSARVRFTESCICRSLGGCGARPSGLVLNSLINGPTPLICG